MLPRSCFLDWLSKSNSSTRVPLTTTTRVSSACAASISIFLDIKVVSTARGEREARAPACEEGAHAGSACRADAGAQRPNAGGCAAHGFIPWSRRRTWRGLDGASLPIEAPDAGDLAPGTRLQTQAA